MSKRNSNKMFYAQPIEVGGSSLSIKGKSTIVGLYNKESTPSTEGAPVITPAKLMAALFGDNVPSFDCVRLSSIIIPAGIHAIVDFKDGRRFNVYSADKPTKLKPSMLAPAHQWKGMADDTEMAQVWIEATVDSGNSATILDRLYAQVIFNLAVRAY